MSTSQTLLLALQTLQKDIATSCQEVGRTPKEITLILVSKGVPAPRLEPLLEGRWVHFGENRVQEAMEKWQSRKRTVVKLHMVGHLQSNKLKPALQLFDVIHSLESMTLAHELASAQDAGAKLPALFAQVNLGGEPQKYGLEPSKLPSFLRACQEDLRLPIVGLMCVPPKGQPATPFFKDMKTLAQDNGLSQLSMGMSTDFREAIREGATHLRIGSAVFSSF